MKIRKTTSYIFLVAIAMFCCCACTRPEDQNEPEYAIAPALRSIFSWGQGSYWIMQDSLSGRVDSFSVTLYDSYDPPYNYGHHDHLGIRITEYPISEPADTVDMGFGIDPQYRSAFVFRIARTNTALTSYQVLQPPFLPNISGYVQEGINYGNVYALVLPMQDDYGDTAKSGSIALVFNKEHGLIRLAEDIPGHSHVWRTVRSLIR